MTTPVLSEDQAELVITAINEKLGGDLICPVSGDSHWELQENLAFIPAHKGVVGAPMYPTVVLLCETCGNTVLLNLFKLGLAEQFEIEPYPG